MNTNNVLRFVVPALAVLVMYHTASAQHIRWEHSYGSKVRDVASSVVETDDGGYVTAGFTADGVGPGETYPCRGYLVKFDRNGEFQWKSRLGSNVYLTTVLRWKNGEFIVAGAIRDSVFIAAVDSGGAIVWQYVRPRPETDMDVVRAINTRDGGFAVANYYSIMNPTDTAQPHGMMIYKFDAAGTFAWAKAVAIDLNMDITNFVQAADGGYMLTGTGVPGGASKNHTLVYHVDSAGTPLLRHDLATNMNDGAHGIITTDDGGYLLGGFCIDLAAKRSGMYLTKTDSRGNPQWTWLDLDSSAAEHTDFYDMTAMPDGGYAVVGYKANRYPYVLRLDAAGRKMWDTTYRSKGPTIALNSIIYATDGTLVLAGTTQAEGIPEDVIVVKIELGTSAVEDREALPERMWLR